MAVKISLEKMKNNSFLIKTVVEPDICLQHGGLDHLPISTKLTEEEFSCELNYRVNPLSSHQIIVTLTDTASVSAVDVIPLNAGPSREMTKKEEKRIVLSDNGERMIVKREEWWEVVLGMNRTICSECTDHSLMRMMMTPVSFPNAQCHFPSHNLYIHCKPKENKGKLVILKHLTSLLENEALADVHFDVTGTRLPAHTLIVSAGSPVLAAMFQNGFEERSTRIVHITDASVEVFRQFLRYLYTGNTPECKEDAMVADLFVMADKYGVDSLKEECALCLAEQLKMENAVNTLIQSHLHSSKTLYEETIYFMSRNALAVCSNSGWLRFMKEYPDLCFEANQRIMQANFPQQL